MKKSRGYYYCVHCGQKIKGFTINGLCDKCNKRFDELFREKMFKLYVDLLKSFENYNYYTGEKIVSETETGSAE